MLRYFTFIFGGNMTGRYLTLNTVIRCNQIEVRHDKRIGEDEYHMHSPENIQRFRDLVSKAIPGGNITWAFSWLALINESENYQQIRELVKSFHAQYGDDVTYISGGFFANAFATRDEVNEQLRDGLAKVRAFMGDGFNPKSVISGFLSAANQQYLAEHEGIHVCQGNIWSQYAIDNQDGEGSICYPYYPSTEHFCKPAQSESDFIDCVNLDGWTCDFLTARREGFADGFNSRQGVGPIETLLAFPKETALREMIATCAAHYDTGYDLNGFGWITNLYEQSLFEEKTRFENLYEGTYEWLAKIKERWPDVQMPTMGDFGLLWREHYKNNDNINYRFRQRGTGIGGSDADKEISWHMTKQRRVATMKIDGDGEYLIDLTDYTKPAQEPTEITRRWSLLGDINQKQTREQDKPIKLTPQLKEELKL